MKKLKYNSLFNKNLELRHFLREHQSSYVEHTDLTGLNWLSYFNVLVFLVSLLDTEILSSVKVKLYFAFYMARTVSASFGSSCVFISCVSVQKNLIPMAIYNEPSHRNPLLHIMKWHFNHATGANMHAFVRCK